MLICNLNPVCWRWFPAFRHSCSIHIVDEFSMLLHVDVGLSFVLFLQLSSEVDNILDIFFPKLFRYSGTLKYHVGVVCCVEVLQMVIRILDLVPYFVLLRVLLFFFPLRKFRHLCHDPWDGFYVEMKLLN